MSASYILDSIEKLEKELSLCSCSHSRKQIQEKIEMFESKIR